MVEHLAAAHSRPLGGATGEGACQRQRGYRLVLIQAQQPGRCYRRTQGSVDRTAAESPSLGGGYEIACDAGLDLVACRHRCQQVGTAGARQLRRGQRRRNDAGPWVDEHPVGVGLVGGVHQLAVGEGRAAACGPGAVGQHRGAVGTGLLVLDQLDGSFAVGCPGADQRDEGGVQQRRLQLVHHLGGQMRVFQSGREPGVGAGEGFGHGRSPGDDFDVATLPGAQGCGPYQLARVEVAVEERVVTRQAVKFTGKRVTGCRPKSNFSLPDLEAADPFVSLQHEAP